MTAYTHRLVLLLSVATTTISCKKTVPAAPQTQVTVVDAGTATTPSTPVTVGVADVPTSAPVIAALAAPIGENLVERLQLTATASSTIAGTANTTAMMTDSSMDTAWNSRTGNLVGGWIEMAVPAGVSVQSIGLTAGFVKQSARLDLFTTNHRITRVRVARDNVFVGEFALNPESRALQAFPLQGDGGTFRVTVAEVLPGSRVAWRELCVSEFVIFGTIPPGFAVPAPSDAGEDPDATAVGAAESTEDAGEVATEPAGTPSLPEALGRAEPQSFTALPPVATVDAYCHTAMQRGYRRRQCQDATTANGVAACFCGQMAGPSSPAVSLHGRGSLQRAVSPFMGAYVMARTNNPGEDVLCDLLVRTPAGLFAFQGMQPCGAPTGQPAGGSTLPELTVRSMRATAPDAGTPELNIVWGNVIVDPGYSAARCSANWNVRCTVDAANVPTCVKNQTDLYQCTVPVIAGAVE